FEGNVATTDNDSGVAGGALSLVGEAGAGVSTISGSVFRSNQARNYGGAIFQSSGDRFEVEDTLFEDNQVFAAANEYGGGASAEAHGGAVTVDRSTEVIIQRSEFLNNSATNYGGALYVGRSGRGGTVEIADSTFEGNQAKISSLEGTLALGGGIYADGPTGDAVDFSLIRSTLSGNSAEGAGGALYASGADLTVTIASSTLDGNSSASGGGAVHLRGVGGSSLAIEHSTITGNQVTGTAVSDAAALYADGPGAIDITHTVIAGNTQGGAGAGNICVGESSVQPGLVYSFWDNSFNADGCNQPLADASNILDETDPGLTDLADNGGYTLTRYPTEGSPLINAGNPNIMAEPDTDQRGSCRVVGGVIDIGAVEFGNHGAVAETLDDQTLSVGQSLILDASQVFSDPEGDALSYELIGAPLGITIDSTSGVISGEPSVAGEFPIEVIATDPCGASASATMSVTVKAAASSDSSGGGGGSMGYFIALLASLVWWRRLRR
ncbi:MAG: choice-of-anchor Q domain-containing protein, partial [Marinobacter sp.]|nr:choice-of-anchor Q domain-containing protein [Marinobacter sp.]